MAEWKISVMLADAAHVSDGKLYILGGGWEKAGPALGPIALAILIAVPWPETNRKHRLHLKLFSSDGQAVEVPTPVGTQALEVSTEFEIGRPPGSTPGTHFNVPLAITILPLSLSPGRYEWIWDLNGDTRPDWRVSFELRATGKSV